MGRGEAQATRAAQEAVERHVQDVLNQAKGLSERFGLSSQQTELARVERQNTLLGFRVAVLGGPKRGKTTLIRRLGTADTAAPDVADELLEFPGRDKPDAPAWQQSEEALLGVDAAVFMVSAVAPLSMSEQAELRFLTGTLGIPFVAVLVSDVDRVESEERDEVVEHIRRRAHGVHPHLPVLLAPTAADGDGDGDGDGDTGTMRELLTGVREDDALPLRRSYRFARQLSVVLDGMAQAGDEHVARHEALEQERQEAAASERRERDSRLLRIQQVQLEVERRGVAVAERIADTALRERGPLASRLELRLASAANPLDWWRLQFPNQLREELAGAATKWAHTLQEGLDSDLRWLEEKLSEYQALPTVGKLPERPASTAPTVAHPPPRLPDLERWRAFVDLVPQAAQLIDRFLSSRAKKARPVDGSSGRPYGDTYDTTRGQLVGLAAEAAATLARRSLDHRLVEQRQTVAERVRDVVARELDDVAQGLSSEVREVYRKAGLEVENAGRSWRRAQEQALVDGSGDPQPDWSSLARQARTLRQEILADISDDEGWTRLP